MAAMGEKMDACPFCKGSGRCGSCEGENKRDVLKNRSGSKRVRLCGACHGYGTCNLCRGTGKRPVAP